MTNVPHITAPVSAVPAPAGYRAGFVMGRLLLGAALVVGLGSLGVLAVGHPSPWTDGTSSGHGSGGGSSGFDAAVVASRAHVAAAAPSSCSAECFGIPARPLQPALQPTPVVDPMDEFSTTTEARGFINAQLSEFASVTQVHDAGLMSTTAFAGLAMQNVNDKVTAPIIADLDSTPMTGGYATSRIALVAGLKEVAKLWHDVAHTGTYEPLDYQLAQASLDVSARYAPSVPPVGS